jgi:hypothetical protein
MSLSPEHRKQLAERGLYDLAISRRGYRTMPLRGRAAICRQIATQVGLGGVPGFFRKREGKCSWWTLAGSPGLLIPVRDVDGQLGAIRIRPDSPTGPKYIWLSSCGREDGTACPTCCHVARPLGSVTDPRLFITEGELKADIASDRLGAVVVSVPGVGSWRKGVNVVREMAPPGGEVVVAFDMDARMNRHVAAHERELVASLHDEGFAVLNASWPLGFKGIDDALVATAALAVKPVSVVVRRIAHRRRQVTSPGAVRIGGQRDGAGH